MRYRILFTATCMLTLMCCRQFDDAPMTERNTFIHFFSSATDYFGLVAEPDSDGGFILSGEIRNSDGVSSAILIKTDSRGHKVWERIIPNSIMRAVRPHSGGYIVFGDSIQLNPGSSEVSELVNSYARLMMLDAQGSVLREHISSSSVRRTINNQPVDLTVDYYGNALSIDLNGNIIVLGNFRVPGENQSTFISSFAPANLNDSTWYRAYRPEDGQDYINCNALHMAGSSGFVWALRNFTQDNVTREYFSVAHVLPASTFRDNSLFGQNDARNHIAHDIQKSAVGFGIIGTYAETNGLNGNIYFIRADAQGRILGNTVRYFDGEYLLRSDQALTEDAKTTTASDDKGLAIAALADGFVLGAELTSTPAVGNGGTDVLLIKLDPFGNLLWKKLIGGPGDESIASIRQTSDKGLLLCGTNTVNGLSTIMLVKTDQNGNLNN